MRLLCQPFFRSSAPHLSRDDTSRVNSVPCRDRAWKVEPTGETPFASCQVRRWAENIWRKVDVSTQEPRLEADAPSTSDTSAPTALVEELDAEEAGVIAAYDRVPVQWKIAIFVAVLLTLAIILAIWHAFYWHWFEVHTGINGSGPYYGFWSGFGSDLGEATLIAGALAVWRHHSCHVRGCARLGRQVEGTPYLACPRHHPAHKGQRRGISLETLRREHAANKKGR